ncbi:MAG: universal stress protein [Candidatus Thermoplasmatota archaeon]|nr:universal stress protein [Candidatus Thermoplasmatota archaeon]
MYRKVILPTDGSDLAMEGVREGLKLAGSLGIPATAICVVEIGDIHISGKIKESLKETAERALGQVEEMAEDMDVELESKIMKGTPYKEICEYAKEDDVIYISSHGMSGFRELFLGSTTKRILQHADCTVSVVKGTPGKVD